MQISPLRIQHNIPIPHIGPGTGKYNKMEVYPTTQTLLKKLRLEPSESLLKEQNKKLEELPNDPVINNLRPYQVEDIKFLAAR